MIVRILSDAVTMNRRLMNDFGQTWNLKREAGRGSTGGRHSLTRNEENEPKKGGCHSLGVLVLADPEQLYLSSYLSDSQITSAARMIREHGDVVMRITSLWCAFIIINLGTLD